MCECVTIILAFQRRTSQVLPSSRSFIARNVEPGEEDAMLRTITKNKKHTFAKACIDLCRGVKRSLVTVAEVGQDNAVALVKLDDGKMNAFSFDMISAIDSAMEDCRDAGAIIISGNEKCLSAGFDLSVMGKGPSPEAGDMRKVVSWL